MNVTEYTTLLNKPDSITDRHTDSLEQIISQFPYFQSARALRLKGLYNQNSFQYNQALKVTAAHTTDRSVLFDFITSSTFTAIHKGLYEKKLAELYGIEVRGFEEVDYNQARADKLEESIRNSIREAEQPAAAVEEELAGQPVTPEVIAPEPAAPDEIAPEEPVVATVDLSEFEIPQFDKKENVTEKTSEQKLGIGQPLDFSREERHSFAEWLQLSRLQPIDRSEEKPAAEPAPIARKFEIIDRFIEANPKMPAVRKDSAAGPIAEAQPDTSSLMTETLARVYLEQKKYTKAIQAYEILILKYPEKSSFFADRISEIKNLQNNTP